MGWVRSPPRRDEDPRKQAEIYHKREIRSSLLCLIYRPLSIWLFHAFSEDRLSDDVLRCFFVESQETCLESLTARENDTHELVFPLLYASFRRIQKPRRIE